MLHIRLLCAVQIKAFYLFTYLLIYLSRTGQYTTVERGYLGLNGLVMVDDGTRCGSNKACYNGDCKSLSYVKQQMVSDRNT